MREHDGVERAFERARGELEVRTAFPAEALAAAEAAAAEAGWRVDPGREELTALPFVTVDPPGSRDLDQALLLERSGDGFRVRYAIADVGCWVRPGDPLDEEAWRRGVTFYSPDRRDPLYPEALSQGAASLLPDGERPAVVFTLELDARGGLVRHAVGRARVRSRAQLTYAQLLQHATGGGALFAGEPWSESLLLLREVGELRLERERERGGVSLPIADQHVQQRAAHRLGYQLAYEEPNAAEEWNAQISLLTGHVAALRMLEGGVGLLRTMPPPRVEDVVRLRVAARALGFHWPESLPYADFLHGVDPAHRFLDVLVWQARRLMRGADYVAFEGEPPDPLEHAALAMPYAHCTAPLRRLADRFVLDLLVCLAAGERPKADALDRLRRLPAVMDEAERRAGRLERRVVDVVEAWELRGREGERFRALVLDVQPQRVEAQLVELPVRARIPVAGGAPPLALGAEVRVRLERVGVEEGVVEFALE